MIFEQDNPIIRVTGIDRIKWKKMKCGVLPRDYSALAFRVKGEAAITCGGKTVTARTNDILYLPQGVGYFADYSDTEIIAIHFISARPGAEAEVYSVQNSGQIHKCFSEALNAWQQRAPGYHLFAMARLYQIIGMAYTERQSVALPEKFVRAVSMIHSDYKDAALSVSRICAEAGISESRFRELFAGQYQKTPVAYITELRVEYARSLISGGMRIEKAAYESGFNDPKYFARVVKRVCGCTPRELKLYGK